MTALAIIQGVTIVAIGLALVFAGYWLWTMVPAEWSAYYQRFLDALLEAAASQPLQTRRIDGYWYVLSNQFKSHYSLWNLPHGRRAEEVMLGCETWEGRRLHVLLVQGYVISLRSNEKKINWRSVPREQQRYLEELINQIRTYHASRDSYWYMPYRTRN